MNIEAVYEELKEKMPKLNIKQNEIMAKHTTFKVGGKADIFIKVKTLEELKTIIEYAKENNITLTIIGNGSNVIVKDNGIRGITLQLDLEELEIEEKEDKIIVKVGSGVKLAMLSKLFEKKEIEGFEFASRNSRYYRWSHSHECWCIWERNERNHKRSNLH